VSYAIMINGQTVGDIKPSRGLRQGDPLLFADDSLLFCKANSVEWKRLMTILECYRATSRQKLNLQKTSLFFNRNTDATRRQEIISLSGLQVT
jgi:hypothetical protein